MSREARHVVNRLIEVDPRRRYRASDLMKENWIRCTDLPLSIFETAGSLFRANSVDGRASMSFNKESGVRNSSKADGFNRNITKIHVQAVENLRSMGFSAKAIEDSLKSTSNGASAINIQNNNVYKAY